MGLTPPLEGGSERHIYEISSRIKETDVLTQKGSICRNKIELPILSNITIIRNISFLISSFIYSLFLLFTFRKKYDLIHIHENVLYFLIPLLKIRYKVVVTVHGIKGFRFYDNKILWSIFRIPLMFANNIIAVNVEDKKSLDKYHKNVNYIPNGVDLSFYNKIKARIDKKVTFIGRIHEQKGIIYLLEAFENVKFRYPEFKLEIMGKLDDYGKNLKERYNDRRIIWRGFVKDRKEIVKSLKSSYMIVLPSVWEGLPLTLFEALASERPVIISDIAAFKSVIKDEAVFFKNKDAKDLEEKISNLIKDSKRANNIGFRGKNLSKRYDWNNIIKKTKEIYEK